MLLANTPWAILPKAFQEIRTLYERQLLPELAELDSRHVAILPDQNENMEVLDGTAVIPVNGILLKRLDLISRIFGGTSTLRIQDQLAQALADPDVHSIILDVDSPGGTVDGAQELASQVFAARGVKPITTFASGMIASAAYWIGSAADRILISGGTTQAGSIGVVATHLDVSKAEERAGIKTTEIVAGKFKRVTSNFSPLSDEGRQTLQDHVDHVYSVFVNDVAKFRGVSENKVLNDMADGRIFIGAQALRAGLVDGVATFDRLLTEITHSTENISMTRAFDEHQIERQCKMTWDKDAGIRGEFRNNFESFLAYTKAEAAGRVRIVSGKAGVVGGRHG